jgi:hypothetical protein
MFGAFMTLENLNENIVYHPSHLKQVFDQLSMSYRPLSEILPKLIFCDLQKIDDSEKNKCLALLKRV